MSSPQQSDRPQRETVEPLDAALVARARAGDDAAFGVLVRRHERAARAVAYSIVGDAHDAEDVVQDALVRAHRNLDLLADPARFGAWLSRVVFGVAVDRLRAERTERRLVAADASELLRAAVADDAPGPHDALERDDLAERVLAAVHALPERYRVPLSLYHLDGVSLARVAEALGVPAGTARSLVARARDRLRTTLASLSVTDDVFDERAEPRLLHVLNGDSVRMTLERSDVPGTFAVWAHVLHDGPVPPFDVGEARWRAIRLDYHTGRPDFELSEDEARGMAEAWDARLAAAPEYDETVIWLEHDLFDQLLLIRHLAWFAGRPGVTLSLISVGEWPGMPHFKGLGELGPDELASLLGTRQRVTQRQLALGRRAWRAFTGDDPRAVERFVTEEDSSSLPFLAAALRRNLEELPGTRDGLARTDRQILQLVSDGVTDLGALFPALHRLETNFFIGDSSFLDRLRALAAEPRPLLRLTEGRPRWFDGGTAALTDDGRDVLAGRADAVALHGIDAWLGGVRLAGHEVAWRWDVERGQVAG